MGLENHKDHSQILLPFLYLSSISFYSYFNSYSIFDSCSNFITAYSICYFIYSFAFLDFSITYSVIPLLFKLAFVLLDLSQFINSNLCLHSFINLQISISILQSYDQ